MNGDLKSPDKKTSMQLDQWWPNQIDLQRSPEPSNANINAPNELNKQ